MRIFACSHIYTVNAHSASDSVQASRRSRVGQRGLISCLAFNPDMSGLFAAGSYAKTTYVNTLGYIYLSKFCLSEVPANAENTNPDYCIVVYL